LSTNLHMRLYPSISGYRHGNNARQCQHRRMGDPGTNLVEVSMIGHDREWIRI
jgi:hypothetical protein